VALVQQLLGRVEFHSLFTCRDKHNYKQG
jgi:hypothetical protein